MTGAMRMLIETILSMYENLSSRTLNLMREVHNRQKAEEALEMLSRKLTDSNTDFQRFAYIASHDLQEPLRMVTSYLGLLEKRHGTVFDDEGREFLHYATDGAQRMSQQIHDLLDYARVESQGRELDPVETSSVVDEALANLSVTIAETGCNIELEQKAFPVALGDRGQLVRVFQNLIGNAIKYRDSSRPTVIRVEVERSGDEWVFAVGDNGIGIAPEYFERIFMIFQRLHGQAEYKGTGIGLAIVKRIVERHGGRIWVESEPGKGAKFFFTLPDDTAVSTQAQHPSQDQLQI
ncbi:Phytochrome-like protein cph1 (fragment) [Candidatus Terasakiella magnetica]